MTRLLPLLALAAGCQPGGSSTTPETRPATTARSAGVADAPPPPAWTPALQPVADANNRFAFDLYAKLREPAGSLFLSPFGIHAALAMTAHGAAGPTRDELTKALRLPADPAAPLAAGDLARFYAGGGRSYELAVANALWVQAELAVRLAFAADLDARHAAGLRRIDFAADPGAARAAVNRWAGEHTRGRIPDLLGPADVTPLTKLVLANAVYFKGPWVDRFDPSATADAPFRRADGTAVPVRLMHRRGDYRYAETDRLQAIALPYRGGDLEMVVVLP